MFTDFWERFQASLHALSEKRQRTVYRLTLVKAWNVEELENYAQLIKLGNPDFIEIKGLSIVTTFTYLRLNSVSIFNFECIKKKV